MPLDPLDVIYFKSALNNNIKSETDVDITARCPICGDSKHSNKARLHLYCKNNITLVNCFNGGCPCSNRTMYTFLRDFFPDLFNGYKQDKFKRVITKDSLETQIIMIQGANANDTPSVSLKQFIAPLSDECRQYVVNRGINNTRIFTAKSDAFLQGKRYPIKGYLFIPLIKANKIYGFYTRSIYEKKFYTYVKEGYTGLKAWNLFQVNLNEPVFIFEGIFDAMAAIQSGIKNSIALMGAKPSAEIMNLIKYPVFCLDNDRTGILTSLEYSKKHPVVIWPNEFKDANEMLQNGVDLYNTIINNQKTGIAATIALRAKL